MDLSLPYLLSLGCLVFLVAVLYSSVGHGGASGYLAILSFFVPSPSIMSSTALVLNILVAGVGTMSFVKAGHFSWKLVWPFVLLSVPGAFLGGYLHISTKLYFILLALVLIAAAYRLATAKPAGEEDEQTVEAKFPVALGVGGGIGILSGIVGVGGGIFLSPLAIFLKWATTKQTAAFSAFFIVVNSIAGLGGRLMGGSVETGSVLPLVGFAFLGGLIGSHYGANRFSGLTLRRILALVLLIASVKLFVTSL